MHDSDVLGADVLGEDVLDDLPVARAEALFASGLRTGCDPTYAEFQAAIRGALDVHGGVRGCALVMAGEYGEHPEAAVPRMRWALTVVAVFRSVSSGTASVELVAS